MKKIILFVILGLIVATGGYYYYEYLQRPEQTIVNIIKALDTKDKTLWNENVAQQTLVENSYRIYKNQFKVEQEDDIYLMVDKLLHGAYSAIMEKGITDDLNSAIDDYFTSNPEELLIVDKELIHSILSIIDYESMQIMLVKIGNKTTMVEFGFVDKLFNHNFIVRTVLEKQDKKWKLVGIVNLNEIIAMIKDKEKDRRNNAVQEKAKEMDRFLQVTAYYGIKTNSWLKDYPILNMIPIFKSRHYVTVKNTSRQDITKFSIKMTYKDDSGWIVTEKILAHEDILKSGDSYKMKLDLYDPVVYGEMEIGHNPEFSQVSLTLESGEVIENEENKSIKLFE